MAAANEQLWRELGRSARPCEVAVHIGVCEEAVIEALAATGCFRPASLDSPLAGMDGAAGVLGDLLHVEDPELPRSEARMMLGAAARRLNDRDRAILHLRFFEGLTQREIAEKIGVTQMQGSRLLTRIFRDMRRTIGETDADVAAC